MARGDVRTLLGGFATALGVLNTAVGIILEMGQSNPEAWQAAESFLILGIAILSIGIGLLVWGTSARRKASRQLQPVLAPSSYGWGAVMGALCGALACTAIALVFAPVLLADFAEVSASQVGNSGQSGSIVLTILGWTFGNALGVSILWEKWLSRGKALVLLAKFLIGPVIGAGLAIAGLLSAWGVFLLVGQGNAVTNPSVQSAVPFLAICGAVEATITGLILGHSNKRAGSFVAIVVGCETAFVLLSLFVTLNVTAWSVVWLVTFFASWFAGLIGSMLCKALLSQDGQELGPRGTARNGTL